MNREEEKYKGINGFKNGAPAYANNNWSEVQLFLDTWGFLPNDDSILDRLNKEQLINLCIYALESACMIDFEGKGIKAVQGLIHKYGISPSLIKKL